MCQDWWTAYDASGNVIDNWSKDSHKIKEYEVSGKNGRGYAIRNGHYHIPSGCRVLMCDERGTEILVKHGWPLFKRFHFQDSRGALGWVAGPEWVEENL